MLRRHCGWSVLCVVYDIRLPCTMWEGGMGMFDVAPSDVAVVKLEN